MEKREVISAMQTGFDSVPSNCDLLVLGEMGISNTTSASAIACALFDGKVESMTGVWSLDFHRHIASQCGLVSNVDYPELFGRGSQARAIAGAIDRWYNEYKGENNA